MSELANKVSQGIYKRSADPKDPQNVNDIDWQTGYHVGLSDKKSYELHDPNHPITVEWEARGKPEKVTPEFTSWKAGYWAAKLAEACKTSGL